MNYITKLLFLFLFLGNTSFANAQVFPKTEQEAKNILCSKWKLMNMEAEGQRFSLPPDMDRSFMTLNSDGTFTEADGDVLYKGKWSYQHKNHLLITDDKDGVEKHKIIKISSSELVLRSSYRDMIMNLVFKRMK